MKSILIAIFCLSVLFSSLTFAESKSHIFDLPAKSLVAQNEFPNIFRPIKRFFKRIFGIKSKVIVEYTANVDDLILSQIEIIATCATSNNSDSSNSQSIEIFTKANDPENDVLIYKYKVSGGKITKNNVEVSRDSSIEETGAYTITNDGAKVVWDLSGVNPGIYTITAGVDDGCGVCGKTVTKEVKVTEYPNCK